LNNFSVLPPGDGMATIISKIMMDMVIILGILLRFGLIFTKQITIMTIYHIGQK
jgi:hypothetical protein